MDNPSSFNNIQGTVKNADIPDIDPRLTPPVDAAPYWPLGITFDMHVYLSTMPEPDVHAKWTSEYSKDKDESLPHFVWKNISYGNYNDNRVANFKVNFPQVSNSSANEGLWKFTGVF